MRDPNQEVTHSRGGPGRSSSSRQRRVHVALRNTHVRHGAGEARGCACRANVAAGSRPAAGERIAGMEPRAVHGLPQLPWGVHRVATPGARGRRTAPCRCLQPASSATSLALRPRLRRTAHAAESHARRWGVTPPAAASGAAAVTFVGGDTARRHPTPADELTVLGVAALVFCDRCVHVCVATPANGGVCVRGQVEL